MKPFRQKAFHMKGERGSALDQARGRMVIVSAVFVLAYIIVAARVVDISIIQGGFKGRDVAGYADESRDEGALLRRADITDRNGVLLARSLRTASLYVDPSMVRNAEEVAKSLVRLFPDLNYGSTLKKIQAKSRFEWLKRNLTPDEQQKVLYLGEPGLAFKDEDRRIYPQGGLTSHLVGYSSVDGNGIAGVESSFDGFLKGNNPSLALTIDVRFQHALRRELNAAMHEYKAKGAAGIVMDVRNGEILALVSLPDFDPHHAVDAKDVQKFNKATLGTYELGSVFKVFSVAAFIDSQKNPLRKAFDAREPLKRKSARPIRDYHAQERILSLPEVFIHSSNIGTALMAETMGTKTLQDYYTHFGLIGKSPLEIPEVATSRFNTPWHDVDTLSASFGHAVAVTPLQLITGVSSIINGGEKIEPTLILNDNTHQKAAKSVSERIVSPQTAHRMRQLMRLNVTDGSGKKANVPGLMVGGKTGTADKPGPGGYDHDKRLSSFVAAFPMDDPRYAVFVMLDEPTGTKNTNNFATAGWVAAPVAGEVIATIANLEGLAPRIVGQDFESTLRHLVKSEEQVREERNAQSH